MREFESQLNVILEKTDTSSKSVKEDIRETQNQIGKVKNDVDELKEQISNSYDLSHEQMKRAEKQQLAAVDQAHSAVQEVLSAMIHQMQISESSLRSITMCGKELKREGTMCDYITSINALITKFMRTNTECVSPITLRWDLDVKINNLNIDTNEARLNTRGGSTGGADPGSGTKTISEFDTPYQRDRKLDGPQPMRRLYYRGEVKGLATYHEHLLIAHDNHDVINITTSERLLGTKEVSSIKNPHGLCVAQGDGTSQQLVVADYDAKCLWWLKLEEQGNNVKLDQAQKHN